MKTKNQGINAVVDSTADLLDKVSSPGSRAGSTVERVGKMRQKNVDAEVIALQMTKNSPKKKSYSTRDIEAYAKLYDDAKTKVVITAAQTRLLTDAQRQDEQESPDELISPN